MSLLNKGISLNEIQTTDIMFYLDILEYESEKERLKEEAKMDSLGL